MSEGWAGNIGVPVGEGCLEMRIMLITGTAEWCKSSV